MTVHIPLPKSRRTPGLKSLVATALLASTMLTSAGMAQAETTITAVMHSGLRVLDPVITTAHITRNHAYMIYDVLTAVDENFAPQPQMASWTISDDQLVYTFTLRDGLTFHDGAPVTMADAEASLKRWAARDTGGQILMDFTESLVATDAATLVWTLSKPFPGLLETISKQSALPPFVMPARIAATSADTAITEYVGSGPFVFVEAEFQPGVSVTYEKFDAYVPRAEPPSWMAGGKVAKVDRVVWVTMPDAQTAINALSAGEIDYLEQVQIDLLPLLEGDPDVTVEVRDPLGMQTMGRMNFKHPPFDDVRIRQAALKALSQEAVLATMMGNPDYYTICGAIFGCGTPLASDAGSETLVAGGDAAAARTLLAEAGYDGTPIVLLQPTDSTGLIAQPIVAAQALREVGFTVDMQSMDWQTLVTRRVNQNAPADGGWNMFFTNWMVPEVTSPLISPMLNGRGDEAWFGWPTDPVVEALKGEFIEAVTLEQQQEIAARIQIHALEEVLYIPLGQYVFPQARRTAITGMIQAPVPVFWNMEKPA